jgi:hypothetical protein
MTTVELRSLRPGGQEAKVQSMGHGPSRLTKSRVKRAVEAVAETGISVDRVEIDRDGRIVIFAKDSDVRQENNPLDQWRAGRGAR